MSRTGLTIGRSLAATVLGAVLSTLTIMPGANLPGPSPVQAAETCECSGLARYQAFEQDRKAILAMAGNYRVTFDFTETVPFQHGYALKEPKLSKATEVVRVIEDTGRVIRLQHILLAGREQDIVIKHWRQDWVYEPETVWDYTGFNAWVVREVSDAERKGAWAQLVYQVDDAPRYAAVARWTHEGGVSSWASPLTWRPLPRRDATTRDDYQVIAAVNRHALTPFGWVHEQDNTKIMLDDENGMRALVREVGVNTYTRADDFSTEHAESYWSATQAFWSAIRREWARIADDHSRFGLTLQGEPEDLYGPVLEIADYVESGRKPLNEAVQEAIAVIRTYLTTESVNGRAMADRPEL